MNRTLIASLALAAFAGSAAAQSNVTAYGVVDANVGWGSGSISTNKLVGTDGLAGSRLGFRGTEDLGGGLRANFLVEHGFKSFDGAAASAASFWNRQVYVGLAGSWGALNLGRQYTPTFMVHASYDAFGPQGVAAQQVLYGSMEVAQPANIRANGALNYQAPNTLGGLQLQVMDSDGTSAPGKYLGMRVGYNAGGALATDIAFAKFTNATIGDLKTVTVGARYKLDAFKFYGLYDRADSGTGADTHGLQFSAAYSMGPTDLKVSVAESVMKSAAGASIGTTRRYGVGFVHGLSKRTSLYGSLAQLNNSNGAKMAVNGAATAANQSAKGLDLGISHAF
ncbi:MAG: porin [Burkholderiales bacterium]|nr:porin [Burkholderiales bacterium]